VTKRRAWLTVSAFLLFLSVAVAFGGALGNGFVFDDQQYVLGNPLVKDGLSWSSAQGAFSSLYAANWHPVTWLSHQVDVSLFGLAPAGHHGVNLLLHAANALLLLVVLARLTGSPWKSLIVALLFSVHPLRVESVAWVAERKDLLSGFFFLLTLGAYGEWLKRPSPKRKVRLIVAFALGLASKPMLVTLPFLFLLLDYWPLSRLPAWTFVALRRLVAEKIPLFALACASAAITVIAQNRGGAVSSLEHHSLATRLLNAPAAYFGYVQQTFFPVDLAVFYPHREGWPLLRDALAGAALLLVVSTLVLKLRRTRPAALVGWCWFLGMLVPVLGLVQVGDQAAADRYTYLPQIGLFVFLIFPLAYRRWSRPLRMASGALAITVVVILAAVSRSDVRFWRSDETLFSRAAAVTDRNWLANFNLALALSAAGKKDEARRRLDEAIVLGPDVAKLRLILGRFLEREGKAEEAAASYREALRLDPRSPEILGRLGNVLSDLGRSEEALIRYRQALEAAPERPNLQYDLAVELLRLGRIEEAEAPLRAVIRLSPNFAPAWNNLGIIAASKGNQREAAEQFSRALAIDPANEDARANLLKARSLRQP